MARRLAPTVLALAVAAWGWGADWPELTYDGLARDAAWLEKAYQDLNGRIVQVDGRYFNLGGAEGGELSLGNCLTTQVTVRKNLAGGDLLVGTEAGRLVYLKGVPAGTYADGSKFGATLLVVGTHRYKPGKPKAKQGRLLYLCRLAPDERKPITREQFAEAIRNGMQLYFWQTCPQCSGSGHTFKKVWRDPYPGATHKEQVSVKEPCARCAATGRLRIREIKRPPQAKPAEKADVDDADDEAPAKK